MTESTETTEVSGNAPRKRAGSINSMLVADLKAMAGALGIDGAAAMKKPQLVAAIKAFQNEHAAAKAQPVAHESAKTQEPQADQRPARQPRQAQPQAEDPRADQPKQDQPKQDQPKQDQQAGAKKSDQAADNKSDQSQNKQGQNKQGQNKQDQNKQDQNKQNNQNKRNQPKQGQDKQDQNKQDQNKQDQNKQNQPKGQGKQDQNKQNQPKDQNKQDQNKQNQQGQQNQADQDDDGEDGSRRNRRRRGRERNRVTGLRNEPDTQILEDDVLVPAAGILDVLDNYAFVRTSGYLAGPDDVYLSLSMVRKFGLRRGDAVVGQVRQPREGERREKFNPMVRVDSVNGTEPDRARERVEFEELTPLHPSQRLRLETGAEDLVGRTIDLLAPIGKGQRGLIVAPARAGRTQVLQSLAESISTNNPECHLMVVLVDERPEEVTEYQRSVKGEVIASTFDRPAADTTAIAELAIDRARRLVELGHDVVLLIDGITRLGRAYNMTAPANGRTLAAGVDANALHPPKKFFGSARKLEAGGSLTILATVMVDSGSPVDELIFEEIRDTANMELWLSREAALAGLFPAVDLPRSGTRHEELLLDRTELPVVRSVRQRGASDGSTAQLESLLSSMQETASNDELLRRLR